MSRGLEDTVRLLVGEEHRDEIGLDQVVKDVLHMLPYLQVTDVLALQDFRKQGIYDITFVCKEKCQRVYKDLERMKKEKVLGILEKMEVKPLYLDTIKSVCVHMYNPKVADETVTAFLQRYCDSVKFVGRMTNKYGYLNGKRKYLVHLKKDNSEMSGFRSIPAVFSIGGERGFCMYDGQARFCRKCNVYGHTKESCSEEREVCRNCKEPGHTANLCTKAKACDICGSENHLARQCAGWGGMQTYANVVGRRFGVREFPREVRTKNVIAESANGAGMRESGVETNKNVAGTAGKSESTSVGVQNVAKGKESVYGAAGTSCTTQSAGCVLEEMELGGKSVAHEVGVIETPGEQLQGSTQGGMESEVQGLLGGQISDTSESESDDDDCPDPVVGENEQMECVGGEGSDLERSLTPAQRKLNEESEEEDVMEAAVPSASKRVKREGAWSGGQGDPVLPSTSAPNRGSGKGSPDVGSGLSRRLTRASYTSS